MFSQLPRSISGVVSFSRLYKISVRFHSVRNNWKKVELPVPEPVKGVAMVKHAKRMPLTEPGQLFQRPPDEKQEFQMYEFIEDPLGDDLPPVKVILLKSVDGVGIRGDIVNVPSLDYHNVLFPTGAAIYATPYDLKLLEQKRQAGELSDLSAEDMVSFEYKKLARVLNRTVIKITMTFDSEWILEKRHLRINLRRAGFIVPEENIVMPGEQLKGPNKNLQGKFITFYVKHTPHCVVPVLGRIDQTSSKGHQLIAVATKDDTKEIEPKAPPIYFSKEPLDLPDDEIRNVIILAESDSNEKVKSKI